MPGLTRDRREGEAVLAGHRVTVIDTAGLEEAPPGSIPARMRAQSETAIGKADLVLFVLDARAGVMPADAAFARLVRASGRPVILVANKSEGRAGADGFYEAFQLGLGEPVAISAEHAEGIGELAAAMLAALGLKPVSRRREEDGAEAEQGLLPDDKSRPIRIAIVGRPNSGKSTLVNALLGEERMLTGPEPGLTRGRGRHRLPVGEPAGPAVRHRGAAPQGAHFRAGGKALCQRCRARHPLRRGGGAAGRRRAPARAPGPHHRRHGGAGGTRAGGGHQQVGPGLRQAEAA
jgi:small GTP-binding protein